MTTNEHLDRAAGMLEKLAVAAEARKSVIKAHDRRIEALVKQADRFEKSMAETDRRWQAYLNTLRRR
jgi:uncharacterized protein (DUF3084 family)